MAACMLDHICCVSLVREVEVQSYPIYRVLDQERKEDGLDQRLAQLIEETQREAEQEMAARLRETRNELRRQNYGF